MDRNFLALAKQQVYRICAVDGSRHVLSSGTGFWCQDYLITNNHIIQGIRNHGAEIYVENDLVFECAGSELLHRLQAGSDEQNQDYAVLHIPEIKPAEATLHFVDPDIVALGDEVALLGYPFGRPYFCLHRGFISSRYKEGSADCLQIDASVNQGNSGGPLIHIQSSRVIGIVSRKATGLTDSFQEMREAVKENLKLLASSGAGTVFIQGINLLPTLTKSQEQILKTVNEIERSANVGIGYAFSVKDLMREPCFSSEV